MYQTTSVEPSTELKDLHTDHWASKENKVLEDEDIQGVKQYATDEGMHCCNRFN